MFHLLPKGVKTPSFVFLLLTTCWPGPSTWLSSGASLALGQGLVTPLRVGLSAGESVSWTGAQPGCEVTGSSSGGPVVRDALLLVVLATLPSLVLPRRHDGLRRRLSTWLAMVSSARPCQPLQLLMSWTLLTLQ